MILNGVQYLLCTDIMRYFILHYVLSEYIFRISDFKEFCKALTSPVRIMSELFCNLTVPHVKTSLSILLSVNELNVISGNLINMTLMTPQTQVYTETIRSVYIQFWWVWRLVGAWGSTKPTGGTFLCARGRLATTGIIKKICARGRGVIALALDKCSASSDLESRRYFQNSTPGSSLTLPRPALVARTEIKKLW